MRIGIGLPTTLPAATGPLVLAWARRAESGPFTSLGVLDRVLFESYDPFLALAAAAGVTSRLRLATTIAIGPLRSTALLAKSAASLQLLSAGRLVLGLAVGAREDDYQVAGVSYHQRGRILADQLTSLHDLWKEGTYGPVLEQPHQAPLVLVGGLSDAAFARVARFADGYVHGGGPPRALARAAEKARAAWADVGRVGPPELWAQGYFALGGAEAAEAGARYLRNYYAFTGPFAERVAAEQLTTPQQVAQFLRGYEEAGCDELVLFPTVADLDQLDRLADVIADRSGGAYPGGHEPAGAVEDSGPR
jgi:alkanesulfonate monooxygenase SsuD/methylene tetrahydromethanopterin reductase-like flavin-dependent oxidoreductase (luciferase family)